MPLVREQRLAASASIQHGQVAAVERPIERRSTIGPERRGPAKVVYAPPVLGKTTAREDASGSADTDDYIQQVTPEWFEDKLYLAAAGEPLQPGDQARARRVWPILLRGVIAKARVDAPEVLFTNLPQVVKAFVEEGVPATLFAASDVDDAVARMRNRGDDVPLSVMRDWHESARDFVSRFADEIRGRSGAGPVDVHLLGPGQHVGADGPVEGSVAEQTEPGTEEASAGPAKSVKSTFSTADQPASDLDALLEDAESGEVALSHGPPAKPQSQVVKTLTADEEERKKRKKTYDDDDDDKGGGLSE